MITECINLVVTIGCDEETLERDNLALSVAAAFARAKRGVFRDTLTKVGCDQAPCGE